MQQYLKKVYKAISGYKKRNYSRTHIEFKAIMSLVGYYMASGDTLVDANDKVDQISHDILKTHVYAIFGMERGNKRCKADLIIKINDVDETTFPFFDDAAKAAFILDLNAEY